MLFSFQIAHHAV